MAFMNAVPDGRPACRWPLRPGKIARKIKEILRAPHTVFSMMQSGLPVGQKSIRTTAASYCLGHDVIVMTTPPGL
jgi:hypothetical protein